MSEAKYNTAKLSTTVTKSKGTQMQKKWIEYNLDFMIDDFELLADIDRLGYDSVLTKINKDGTLKKMDNIEILKFK